MPSAMCPAVQACRKNNAAAMFFSEACKVHALWETDFLQAGPSRPKPELVLHTVRLHAAASLRCDCSLTAATSSLLRLQS